ncbi:hypothetical protein DIS24_g7689 [Lasiodiplodia hormozganensis]|uniref:Uncharacterized protein n=1 Tax=Lasiodiplodia hormozganensis TaxID=869390 RepID=A0AA39Y8W9_9PEZI|nr:hypothetical protein DIS24_g7689 [Lasiodiplodia hormozganensis]
MSIWQYIEYYLSKLLYSLRAHDAGLFIKSPAFAALPEPNITLECPQCGSSGSQMLVDLTQDGKDEFPHLRWTKPPQLDVKEYILLCEDVDAPLPFPVAHSVFYAIPAETTQVTHEDTQPVDGSVQGGLKAGFRWVPNIRKRHYLGPRPLVGHGPHRYVYQLVALSEPLDLQSLGSQVTKTKIAEAIKGKVVGWGSWVGVYERTWQS